MAEVALPAPGATADAPPRPDFEIVPLRGLPIVAAVLVALIAAIAANKLWALEFFHVAGGALWTSSSRPVRSVRRHSDWTSSVRKREALP